MQKFLTALNGYPLITEVGGWIVTLWVQLAIQFAGSLAYAYSFSCYKFTTFVLSLRQLKTPSNKHNRSSIVNNTSQASRETAMAQWSIILVLTALLLMAVVNVSNS